MIILSEHGDLMVFDTLEEVLGYIEPPEVQDKEYEFFDEKGYVYKATVEKYRIFMVKTEENRRDDLRELLEKYLRRLRHIHIPDDWIDQARFCELVLKVREITQ